MSLQKKFISNEKDLCKILKISQSFLNILLNKKSYFINQFINKKGRKIQEPKSFYFKLEDKKISNEIFYKLNKKELVLKNISNDIYRALKETAIINTKNKKKIIKIGLKEAHRTINQLILTRFKLPDYIHSKKERGIKTLIQVHQKDADFNFYSIDIKQFFPSVKKDAVKEFFRKFCNNKIAIILSKITTFKNEINEESILTGSPVSQLLAYFGNKNFFDGINAFAKKNKCTFTCYVDNIHISGRRAKIVLDYLKKFVKEYNLILHKQEEFLYYQDKIVLGNILKSCNKKIRINKEKESKIQELNKKENKTKKDLNSLNGLLNHKKYIEE